MLDNSHLQQVAVLQHNRILDALAVVVGAVFTAHVFQDNPFGAGVRRA